MVDCFHVGDFSKNTRNGHMAAVFAGSECFPGNFFGFFRSSGLPVLFEIG